MPDLAQTLWQTAEMSGERFDSARAELPNAVRLYLDHAIAPGTVLAHAVRLRMHGEIKLKGWSSFAATQVIAPDRGMVWSARTRIKGLPVSGADLFVDGEGESRWRLFGLIPVMHASGPDIARSVAGRMAAELVWLPSRLVGNDVEWHETGPLTIESRIALFGFETILTLTLSPEGRVLTMSFPRWGNPNGLPFGLHPFGGVVEEEATFDGHTIPSRLRVGWHFGTDRFARDGEFFHATLDEVEFR